MGIFGGNRTVSVALEAKVTGYLAGFRQAAVATRDFAKSAGEASQKHKAAWSDIGGGALKAGAVIGVGVGLAIKSFADFDKAMSKAAAGTQATGAELGQMRAAAIKAGADTMFSATEAADAITAMGKAGVSTRDILGGGLKGALDLAAAGELDVGQAGEIAATAMTQFQLAGKDLPHVADLLAAGAGKAQGEVTDLAGALKYVGPVAHGMGVTIEETVGTLAEFAAQGIISEQAGTGLRGVLSTLSSPSRAASKEMKALGINVYDAQGNFVGLAGVAGELHGALGKMTQAQRDAALGMIFGNEQLTAARVLYAGGAQAVQKWTASVDDQGFAAKQAAQLTDNLSGDVERLGGSLQTALIQSGSGANGVLRDMVKTAEEAVNAFAELPAPVQQTALAVAATASASLLLVGATAKAVGAVTGLKANLAELGVTSAAVRSGIGSVGSFLAGPWGLALTGAALGLTAFALQEHQASERAKELRDSLDEQSGAVTKATRALVAHRLQEAGVLDKAKGLGLSLSDVTAAALGNSQALGRLDSQSDNYIRTLDGFGQATVLVKLGHDQMNLSALAAADAMGKSTGAADVAQGAYIGLRSELTGTAGDIAEQARVVKQEAQARGEGTAATKQASAAQSSLAATTQSATEASRKAKEAQDALRASLDKTKNAFLELRGDERGYEAALDAATQSVKDNGRTLDINTDKGRSNASALDDLAGASLDYLKTLNAQNAPADQFNSTLVRTRSNLEKAARGFGLSKKAAKEYVDKILDIPDRSATTITQPGMSKAQSDAKSLTTAVKGVPDAVKTYFTQPGLSPAITQSQTLRREMQQVPPLVSTAFSLNGIADAIVKVERVTRDLKTLDGKVVATKIVTKTVTASGEVSTSTHLAKAGGGRIPLGLGGPRQDNVLAAVSSGEYVVQAKAVDRYGVGMLDAINAQRFADGGFVARSMATAPSVAAQPVRGGDTYVVQASTTSAAELIREQQYQVARVRAVQGRL